MWGVHPPPLTENLASSNPSLQRGTLVLEPITSNRGPETRSLNVFKYDKGLSFLNSSR